MAEEQSDSLSEFKPPILNSPTQDHNFLGEVYAFRDDLDQDKVLSRQHNHEIHGIRKAHAWLLFGLTVVWVVVLWGILMLQGFGRWYTPVLPWFEAIPFHLSDTVLIAFMTTTTATVLGLYGIAAYWLYGNGKAKKKAETPP